MVCICVVKGCNNTSSGSLRTHTFPKDLEIFNKWTAAVGKNIEYEKRKNYVVCDVHFSDDNKFIVCASNRSNLIVGAVPTLLLDLREVSVGSVSNNTHNLDETISDPSNAIPDAVLRISSDPVPPCAPLKSPGLLRQVNVGRVSHLRPKAKKLYYVASLVNKKLKSLKTTNKQNIERAIRVANSNIFKNMNEIISAEESRHKEPDDEIQQNEHHNKIQQNNRAHPKKMRSNEETTNDACEVTMEAEKRLKEKDITDEFDVYAKYIASELRNIKDEYSTLIAKRHINNILINARLGKYRPDYLSYGDNYVHVDSPGTSTTNHWTDNEDRRHSQNSDQES